jgi:hypothetical protein
MLEIHRCRSSLVISNSVPSANDPSVEDNDDDAEPRKVQ